MNLSPPPSTQAQAAAERYAHRITARLTAGNEAMPYDISERLRASRMQALAKRKIAVTLVRAPASAVSHHNGTATLGGDERRSGWWNALISAVPLTALVVGLVVINVSQAESTVTDLAEVDAALLTDDLPPAAYADPGFVQFLKTSTTVN